MKDSTIKISWEEFILKYQEYFQSNEEKWYNKLNEVIKYIELHKKAPLDTHREREIKQLGMWVCTQKQNFKQEQYIMKDSNIRKTWEDFTLKYQEYLLNRTEIWYDNLNKLEIYIELNKKNPSQSDKNLDIKKLGRWIKTQKDNYDQENKIMKNLDIKKAWEEFALKYQEYFQSNEEIWYNNLNKVKKYIELNNKTPSRSNKKLEIKKLGEWLLNQKRNYKTKEYNMKDLTIKKEWEEFALKYKEYF